jgi:hypothetical protein
LVDLEGLLGLGQLLTELLELLVTGIVTCWGCRGLGSPRCRRRGLGLWILIVKIKSLDYIITPLFTVGRVWCSVLRRTARSACHISISIFVGETTVGGGPKIVSCHYLAPPLEKKVRVRELALYSSN